MFATIICGQNSGREQTKDKRNIEWQAAKKFHFLFSFRLYDGFGGENNKHYSNRTFKR